MCKGVLCCWIVRLSDSKMIFNEEFKVFVYG